MKTLIPILSLIVFFSCKNNSANESAESANLSEDVQPTVVPVYDIDKTTLTWTAFKTEKKVGVKGTFNDITLTDNTFSINTESVDTGEPNIRDPKLVKFFFQTLADSKITGSYGTPKGDKIPMTIKMNGVEKSFDFNYEVNDTATVVTGTIDIVSDFGGSKALESINEACFELHEGKTWSDVDIQIVSLK